jgi:biotin synthase
MNRPGASAAQTPSPAFPSPDLQNGAGPIRLSTMTTNRVDVSRHKKIAALGEFVLAGGKISRDDALFLFHLESSADIFDLLSWANRIREHFKGNKIHLCSIVNAKAGGCSENCKFCAQSSFYQTGAPKYGFVEPEPVQEAADEARRHGVTALGLVAAWRGLNEGPVLDEVCERIRELKANGKVRPDASLGLIKSPRVAERLRQAGLECYNHNLESSRRFFPQHCTTHTFEDRLETIRHLKNAGIKICSGGIIGMGETREDRCDLALELRAIGAHVVPLNILNPIPGTPFASQPPLPVLEILKTIACFRFILPRQEIMIAGGRTVNLRDAQSLIFMAGASALMVGNYLTTLNQPVEKDLQMLKDLGLDPTWDKHGFSDQEPGNGGGEEPCPAERELAVK